jgi:hypothetical protein
MKPSCLSSSNSISLSDSELRSVASLRRCQVLIASPIAAYILNANILRKDNAIYWVEFCGIWAFAAYWIVKGIEMSGPDTEKKVAAGVPYDPRKLHIVASVKSMLSGGTSTTIPTPPSP